MDFLLNFGKSLFAKQKEQINVAENGVKPQETIQATSGSAMLNEGVHEHSGITSAQAVAGPTDQIGGQANGEQDDEPYAGFTLCSRPIEEIYKEDEDHFEQYKGITDDDEEITITAGHVQNPVVIDTWRDANLHQKLCENTARAGYIRPRKIQSVVIPLVLDGFDVQAQSENGSGKTAAFGIPIIQKILEMGTDQPRTLKPQPIAIIFEPSLELCEQIYDQIRKFSSDTNIRVCHGRYIIEGSIRDMDFGCDILVATPRRFAYFVKNGIIELDRLKFVVIDEADLLLDGSFVENIVDTMEGPGFPTVDNLQTLLFSATLPEAVQEMAERVMKPNFVFVTNMKPLSPSQKIVESFEKIDDPKDKAEALYTYLLERHEEARRLNMNHVPQILVFVETCRDAERVALYLNQKCLMSTCLNEYRLPEDRLRALNEFCAKEYNVLVATDVCARGLDLKDVDHVLNFDLPNDYVTYIHRIGRCGRLRVGYAHSFFDLGRDAHLIKPIVQNLICTIQTIPEFFN